MEAAGGDDSVPFAYFQRLTKTQQRIYRRSDGISAIPLPEAKDLRPLVDRLAEALAIEDRLGVEVAAESLLTRMTMTLKVPPLSVRVLAVRPSQHWGELHGLYTSSRPGHPAQVTVWMRTAQRHEIVKFRTFLRTLLHELCHHLDYALLRLPDSFHTEGFYQRESSLLKQLTPAEPTGRSDESV
jgi:hypothetical protein